MNNPPYPENHAQASEYLRLALALLSSHKIPPSPFNYQMGYDYVAGSNLALKSAFDSLVKEPDEPSHEELYKLYRRFFVQDDKTLQSMRKELRSTLITLKKEFERSGTDLSGYAGTLEHFAKTLDEEPTTSEALVSEVKVVVESTRAMEQSHKQLREQLESITREVNVLRNELDQVKKESLRDSLSTLANRRGFDIALNASINSTRKNKSSLCILVADIDHFKNFNDSFGHLIGDKVIRFVASSLKLSLKGKDLAARMGGDEFAVVLPETDINGAYAVAENIRKAVSSGRLKDVNTGKAYDKVTLSIGVAQFYMSDSAADLLKRADNALYMSKNQGRNRVVKAS